jgi:hypothetical protein
MTMRGTFEALFKEETPIIDGLDEALRCALKCIVCQSDMHITRDNGPRFLMAERINCTVCGQEQEFPLFWLMSQRGGGPPADAPAAADETADTGARTSETIGS